MTGRAPRGRRRRLQPGRRRGVRRHDRPADRRVPPGAGVRASDRSSCPTASRWARRSRAAVAGGARVVLTTGGTGLTPTDRTPEVTRPLLDREVPGHRRGDPRLRRRQRRPDRRALARAGRRRRALPGRQPARLARRREGRPRGARAGAAARRGAGRGQRPRVAPGWPVGWPARLTSGRSRCVRSRAPTGARGARCASATPPGCSRGRRPCRRTATAPHVVPAAGAQARPPGPGREHVPFAVERRRPVRRAADRQQHRARLGAVRLDRLLARPRRRRPRRDADGGGDGDRPLLLQAGLHRIEIAIRPENSNSLRVVEKLGIREIGFAPLFLHIDGAWRDHRLFAITVEEWPAGGLLAAARPTRHTSHTSCSATHLWTSAPCVCART